MWQFSDWASWRCWSLWRGVDFARFSVLYTSTLSPCSWLKLSVILFLECRGPYSGVCGMNWAINSSRSRRCLPTHHGWKKFGICWLADLGDKYLKRTNERSTTRVRAPQKFDPTKGTLSREVIIPPAWMSGTFTVKFAISLLLFYTARNWISGGFVAHQYCARVAPW